MGEKIFEDSTLAAIILEQYAYFGFISTNVGLKIDWGDENDAQLCQKLSGRLRSTMCGSNIHGFLFGLSYALFEIIPEVTSFSKRTTQSLPRHKDPTLFAHFRALEQKILSWVPNSGLPYLTSSQTNLHLWLRKAGLLQQLALLIFLRAALNGPGTPAPELMPQIEGLLEEFVEGINALPLDSTAWTQLLWAVLIAGSCMRTFSHRQRLSLGLKNQRHAVHIWQRILQFLDWTWENMDSSMAFYGPFGINSVMKQRNVQLSLG